MRLKDTENCHQGVKLKPTHTTILGNDIKKNFKQNLVWYCKYRMLAFCRFGHFRLVSVWQNTI